ncbi:hypothetical protein [uncultured Legionella sp.]|uniref:hypothetical protein n=1 Tax=uncultured Legionella sp. TaxID=210934 RepID=UPI00262CA732|nr:hypothetical protein [uncultured Legionella sp.]
MMSIHNEQIFKALPPHLTTLDLSEHGLYSMPLRELLEFFKLLPKNLNSLNLSNNFPNLRFVKIFDQFMKALPVNLTALILSNNHLNDLPNALLYAAFENLPSGLVILDISFNNLGQKTDKQLGILFDALPKSVECVYLQDPELNKKTDMELSQLLPSTVHYVITDKEKRDLNKARLINDIESLLAALSNKSSELKKKNNAIESNTIKSIYVHLNLLKNKYNNGALEYNEFESQSLSVLDVNESVLFQHSECKELLIDTALYIIDLTFDYFPYLANVPQAVCNTDLKIPKGSN